MLLLGGRAWQVNYIDWQRRVAYVEATEATGRTRWKGEGQGLGFELSQAIQQTLATEEVSKRWSRRATERLSEMRLEFPWLEPSGTVVLLTRDGQPEWWNFGGKRANATLARQLAAEINSKVRHDSFTLTFESTVTPHDLERAITTVRQHDAVTMHPAANEVAIDGLKFPECLPIELATETLERRLGDAKTTERVLRAPVKIVAR